MNEHTDCNFRESDRLSDYLDGRLDGAGLRSVAAHLRDCASCRHELNALSMTQGALRTLKTPSLPPNAEFWPNAYRAARLQSAEPKAGWFGGRWTLTPASRLVASMTAFVAVVLVFMLPTALHQQGSRVPVNAISADAEETTLNVSDLIRSHTQYAATQPLADDSHLSMVLSEESARREAADMDRSQTPDGSGADDGFGPGTVPDASLSSN